MGLRFRRSITLCKGVRLNVGKSGVSISAGIPGFRKTIHSSGRVTTSVGIPGSGLYYVDTEQIGRKKKEPLKSEERAAPAATQRVSSMRSHTPAESAYTRAPSTEPVSTAVPSDDQTAAKQVSFHVPVYTPAAVSPPAVAEKEMPEAADLSQRPAFRELFENCDLPVNWMDVLTNREPVDDNYNAAAWDYLHSKAVAVFEGDVETMLQIIDVVGPFDDLKPYAKDFRVEMENAEELDIEFSVIKDRAPLSEFQDAVCSVLIRAARDAFALLPVERVTVYAVLDGKTILAAKLDRDAFASLEFAGKDPSDLLETFDTKMKYSPLRGFQEVEKFR